MGRTPKAKKDLGYKYNADVLKYRGITPPLVYRYLESLALNEKSPNTLSQRYYTLKSFFKFVSWRAGQCGQNAATLEAVDDFDFAALPEEVILGCRKMDADSYKTYLHREHARSSSRVHSISIRSFYRFLMQDEQLDRDVMQFVSVEGTGAENETAHAIYLKSDEVAKLLLSVKKKNETRDTMILMLFLVFGLRLSELCSLDVDDVQFRAKRLVVRRGKGGKTRVLPLDNKEIVRQLKDYLKYRKEIVKKSVRTENPGDERPLFLSERMVRISRRRVQNIVEEAIRAAGLSGKNYSTHKLRHTAATYMYNNGADLAMLKDVLGHKNLNTTTIYAHPDEEARSTAISSSPLLKPSYNPREVVERENKKEAEECAANRSASEEDFEEEEFERGA